MRAEAGKTRAARAPPPKHPSALCAPPLTRPAALLVSGGACWWNVNSAGRCNEILSQGVTKAECCGGANAPETTAYSEEDYENGALFFWQVLGGGVKCDSCRVSCEGVRCAEGRRCVLRRGMPKCVCRAECPRPEPEGPVCGTDGRTYRSLCRLRRRLCRKGSQELGVAYAGQCRSEYGRGRVAAPGTGKDPIGRDSSLKVPGVHA